MDILPSVNPIRGVKAKNGDDVFIFDRSIEALPLPPAGFETDPQVGSAWAHANGGVDADLTFVELVIQGRHARSVVLTDLQIEVQHRDPPPAGVAVDLTEGGDGVDGRNASVDLDDAVPRLTGMVNHTDGEPWSFPLRVSEEAVEVLYLWVSTRGCDCRWVANLHFVADNAAQMIEINNNGKPFRTVASTKSELYEVRDGTFVRQR